jgi:pyruvate kinase
MLGAGDERGGGAMGEDELAGLRAALTAVRAEIEAAGAATLDRWRPYLGRPDFAPSAANLAHFLALRATDRTALQRRLRGHGLSTLGRSEGHVAASLDAIDATLAGRDPDPATYARFERARARLQANTATLFGPPPTERSTRVLVTLSRALAEDRAALRRLVELGMNAVRINCARDEPASWRRMADAARAAARDAGGELRVLMDLAGPKIRTTAIRPPGIRVAAGDSMRLRRDDEAPGRPDVASCGCTLPAVLDAVRPGATAAIDDGAIWAEVEAAGAFGLDLRVTRTKPGGVKLKAARGLNFPGTALPTSALTAADRAALATVVETADLVGYSFVQRPGDVDDLLASLAAHGAPDTLGVVAKIETELAFRNLPEIVVRAAGRRPFGLMVARGDLGVEVGFARLSEVQEEILWLAEAAHVPVVWATEVLASLVKNGVAARGEFTDAAMSARAECVMLNKGAFIADGVATLADVLRRAERHLDKKTPQLARLQAWRSPLA